MLPYFSVKYNNPHSQITNIMPTLWRYWKSKNRNGKINQFRSWRNNFYIGATESNNLAIKGMLPKVRRGKNHFIALNTEHKCVLEALER